MSRIPNGSPLPGPLPDRYRLAPKDSLLRAYTALERRHHRLLYLFLEITTRCNLRCLHCGSDCRNEPQKQHIDTESWARIVRHMGKQFPGVAIVLTGGEPLLHSELAHITSALLDARLAWGLVTNGTLLTRERMDRLIDHGLSSITISLDGPQAVHDWLRNTPGSYDHVVDALRIVAQRSPAHADAVTCVTPRTLNVLDDTAAILLQSGIREWRLFRVFPAGRARGRSDLLLDETQTVGLLEWVRTNRERLRREGLSVSYGCEGWLPSRLNARVRDPLTTCRAGSNIASILCDGTVTGCPNNHSRFAVGNIVEDRFTDLWETGFEAFRRRAWLAETQCSQCRYLQHCRGGSLHLWQEETAAPAFCYAAALCSEERR